MGHYLTWTDGRLGTVQILLNKGSNYKSYLYLVFHPICKISTKEKLLNDYIGSLNRLKYSIFDV